MVVAGSMARAILGLCADLLSCLKTSNKSGRQQTELVLHWQSARRTLPSQSVLL